MVVNVYVTHDRGRSTHSSHLSTTTTATTTAATATIILWQRASVVIPASSHVAMVMMNSTQSSPDAFFCISLRRNDIRGKSMADMVSVTKLRESVYRGPSLRFARASLAPSRPLTEPPTGVALHIIFGYYCRTRGGARPGVRRSHR